MTNASKQHNLTSLRLVAPGLYETETTVLPFDKRYMIKSFVLVRPQGNVIIYHSPSLEKAQHDIKALGGATRILINHEHESLGGKTEIDLPFWIHEDDAKEMSKTVNIAGQFTKREMLDSDIEVIPAPGHTPGTTMYLWDNGEHRYLFTGDFICVDNGEWRTVILSSSDREASIKSLEMIRDLEFDAIVPWVAIKDEPSVFFVENENDKRERLQNIIDRVRNGENT
ncbi:MBL fold metallo-hydrolase [Staphylococcus pragensis]|uniref:MBL fold metallo-hydrolase n=1 Tax=Staphylococcus pragensis TaxID=1611836 RepID=A0A4Z1BH06_9STAP|nr:MULTISPECIES: MBL fold metallo-hydrolase [Staphylococcus]RTX91993.1 MBL fold metallo-hydrolase [Staphylococcus carnosus]TGN26927.1 MBL fold metallo-hydrolase [Staphylococcus pragensis]GGG93926.1 MBL fold hydrolase [Staphylococcus pragensis]